MKNIIYVSHIVISLYGDVIIGGVVTIGWGNYRNVDYRNVGYDREYEINE
jgi:hypothetical protein